MNIQYRLGTMEDLPEVCTLVRSVTETLQKQGNFQWDEYYPDENFLRQDIQKNQLFLGIIEGELVAIGVLNQYCEAEYQSGKWTEPNAPYYVLHRFCVNPRLQSQGIGRNMLSCIEQTAIQLGAQWIRLDVFAKNPRAIRLYQHSGYQKTGSVHWKTGEFYLMEKHLIQRTNH